MESATAAGVVNEAVPVDDAAPRVRPGWLSRFYAWCDRLPLRGWWLFPAMAGILLAIGHAIIWSAGRLPFGTFDPVLTASVVYGPYALWAVGYLNRVAGDAVRHFWPATGWPIGQRSAWEEAFTTVSAGLLLPGFVLGIAIAIAAMLSAPASVVGTTDSERFVYVAALAPSAVFGYSMTLVVIAHTARQLRLVVEIHRKARAIDPFDRVPVYAFSRFTAQIGLAFLVSGYYTLTLNNAFQTENLVGLVVLTSIIAFGAACFVVPLWGIHNRLVGEKDSLLAGVEARVTKLAQELYRRIDAGDYEGTKTINEAIAAAGAVRERINRLPTWPWPPQLLRGFLTALLLPVIVYLVSRLVAGQIGA